MITVSEAIQLVLEIPQKSRAPLYHFTNTPRAYKILKGNTLNTTDTAGFRAVFFTRNKNLWHRNIRLEFDQVKIRYNYELVPRQEPQMYKDEDEEYIKKPLKNLDRYLVGIKINSRQLYGWVSWGKKVKADTRYHLPQDAWEDIEIINYLISHPKLDSGDLSKLRKVYPINRSEQ